ncbi:response regulator [Candidatus Sumerlaeota bacterium]|nr:response regulator [Candidatus Sumerlaeota bacterium]
MAQRDQKILFIDDDKNFRNVTAYLLKDEGYKVTVAENSKEGLAQLDAFQPDVILSDLKMPVMDGMEFLR